MVMIVLCGMVIVVVVVMMADAGGGDGDDGGGVGGDGEEPARSQTRTGSMTKCVCTRGWTEII